MGRRGRYSDNLLWAAFVEMPMEEHFVGKRIEMRNRMLAKSKKRAEAKKAEKEAKRQAKKAGKQAKISKTQAKKADKKTTKRNIKNCRKKSK